MAEVIGFLRDDATGIEKQILQLLSRHLPGELTVYVESPTYMKQYSRTIGQSRDRLPGPAGCVQPIHGFKGLEADAVLIPTCRIHSPGKKTTTSPTARARRIFYLAMNRAREKLYMTYFRSPLRRAAQTGS